jgi:oxazoline/thiazoline synthase
VTVPRLRAGGQAVADGATAVLVGADTSAAIFHGPSIARLLALLDGRRSVDELVEALPGVPVEALLRRLEADGHVSTAEPTPATAMRDALGLRGAAAVGTVGVRALGAPPAVVRAFAAAAGRLGLAVREDDEDADLLVVLADDYLREELAAVGRRRAGAPWLLAQPAGATVRIGPVFTAEGPCWTCFAHRLALRAPARAWLRARGVEDGPAAPAVLDVGAQLTAMTALRALAGTADDVRGGLLTVDLADLAIRRHPVTRRPQCPACGTPPDPAREPPRPQLRASLPGLRGPGGVRSRGAGAALAAVAAHVDDVTGLVGEPRPTGDPDEPLAFSYVAEHAFTPPTQTVESLRRRSALRSGGKGATREDARASAIGEALERYCGTWHGDEPVRRARGRDLGDDVLTPPALLGFSAQQHRAAREAPPGAGVPAARRPPAPWDPDVAIDWAPVWSLTHERRRLVPASGCYYGHPEAPDPGFMHADSNGCAAGGTLEEAVLQGLLELVERDAVAIWWFNRLRRPAVDLDGADDEYVQRWRARLTALGYRAWALDVTNDLELPVVAAIAESPSGELVYGFGAHVERRLALIRALTEVNQSLPRAQLPVTRSALSPDRDRWRAEARAAAEPWLTPADAPAVSAGPDPGPACDVGALTRQAIAAVERRGLEVLVLDQSRPDVELAVVRTIVPGLRHFWRRLGPGRLYDVPVAMGLLDRATAEEDVNPWDIYF